MSVASVVENQGTKLVSDCGRSGITGAGHGICAWLGAEGGYPSQYQHGEPWNESDQALTRLEAVRYGMNRGDGEQ